MREGEKLEEAKYFYQQMLGHFDDRTIFTHDLSAFLSAARSVLQYARKQAATKPGGTAWYEGRMSSSAVLRFFKEKRDANIHDQPINPLRHSNVTLGSEITLRGQLRFVHKDGDGNTIQQGSSAPAQESSEVQRPSARVSISHRWLFRDWPGTEDVVTLCENCIGEMQDFVKDGIDRAFLSA